MTDAPANDRLAGEQDQRIADAFDREQGRLRNFIRRHVPDRRDAEDILQDVLYELVAAFRLEKPVEHVGAWLFRVTRNRVVDLFRIRKTMALDAPVVSDDGGDTLLLEDLLPSAEAGPEAVYARSVLIREIENALDELPEEQRAVFLAHELERRSFKELAAETGVSLNTLLSRKHYAVLFLRRRLQAVYDEYTNG